MRPVGADLLLIAAAWATQEQLEDSERHAVVGYLILALLLFRLLWSVLGSDTARFSSFIRGPAKVWTYKVWTYLRGSGLVGQFEIDPAKSV